LPFETFRLQRYKTTRKHPNESAENFRTPQNSTPPLPQRTVEEAQTLAEQVVASVPAVDAVVAVRVDQLTEVLVSLHQRLGVLGVLRKCTLSSAMP